MKLLTYRTPTPSWFKYDDDIDRMLKICIDAGYSIQRRDLIELWCDFSDELCATWLLLPEQDEDILQIILEKATPYSETDYVL